MTSDPILKNALVTGATSGIGAAAVRTLAASGRTVLAVARRQDRLEALAGETGCSWMVADVRDTERLRDRIDAFGPDIIVNNAGVGHGSSGLADLDAAMIQEAFDINVVAPVQITALVLAGMRARARGHIVNIGSIAGLHNLVSAVYGGTKSALHRFSQNLRVELLGSGIRVTELCPGRVTTEFYQAASGDREKLDRMGQSGIRELDPADVAAAILFAVNAPLHVNVATIELLPTEQSVGGINSIPTDRNP